MTRFAATIEASSRIDANSTFTAYVICRTLVDIVTLYVGVTDETSRAYAFHGVESFTTQSVPAALHLTATVSRLGLADTVWVTGCSRVADATVLYNSVLAVRVLSAVWATTRRCDRWHTKHFWITDKERFADTFS